MFWDASKQDLGYAIRQLRKAPGFTVTAVLCLSIGVWLAWDVTAFGRGMLAGFFVGVDAFDPRIFAGAAVVILAVSLLASHIPGRRAARLEPMNALRSE
jgi:putative ABC transport system permease protein